MLYDTIIHAFNNVIPNLQSGTILLRYSCLCVSNFTFQGIPLDGRLPTRNEVGLCSALNRNHNGPLRSTLTFPLNLSD